MGTVTIDNNSPGRRQSKRYSVAAALDSTVADQESLPVGFRYLKNCLVDKRSNALLKRPGSTTETIANGLGIPLGAGEYDTAAVGFIPINNTILANFSGTFYQNQAGVWSAVSTSSRCNFQTSRQCQFTKLNNKMFIAAGLPAKWKGPGTTIDRVGIVAPTAAAAITSYSSGTGITLTESAQYVYTYFDSTTGLESDWSPLSNAVPPIDNKSVVITIPTVTAANWDKINIYRTLDRGTFPYFVASISGTFTYTDSTPDEGLQDRIRDRYERSVPPSTSFIASKFAQCIWMIDGNDPYSLRFSNPDTGDSNELEYFPIDNEFRSNEPMTGLLVVPGKMLVFHGRSISYVSGSSVDDFVFLPFNPGVGTIFPNSIATNGTDIVFLAEAGFVRLPISDGDPEVISSEIDEDIGPILSGHYNLAVYASTCWNPSLRQFVFMLNAQSATTALWEEVGSGSVAAAVAGWQIPASTDDTWEDATAETFSAQNKIKLWGWSPELSGKGVHAWMEYTFPTITDGNSSGAYPVFVMHPQPSADSLGPQQDRTFLGFYDGTQGKIRTCFRNDKTQDDATAITSEWITGRLVPGLQTGGFKLFHALGFQNSYSDPTADGGTTLKYLIDFDDPQLRSFSGSLITITETDDLKNFPTMLGRHIHLYGIDTSSSLTKILLGEFFIHFRERMRREGR